MSQVIVPLAEGFEELEAITIIDLLRRGNINVCVAGLVSGPIKASRGTVILPDCEITEALNTVFDMVVLPGGQPGATNLAKDPRIFQLLKNMSNNNAYIAAICAAPKILALSGLLNNKKATCFPGAIETAEFENISLSDSAVVVDEKIITSRGPGTAIDFALQLIELLSGRETRDNVEKELVR